MLCTRARAPVHHSPAYTPKRCHTTYAPHAFDKNAAISRIMDHEKKRWLAPFENEFPKKEGIVISEEDPVRKVFFANFRMRGTVRWIKFDAQAGYSRTETATVTNHEGKTEIHTRHKMDYSYVPKILLNKELFYSSKTSRFTIAGCLSNYMYDEMVEETFDRVDFKKQLKVFTPEVKKQVDKVFDFDLTFSDAMTIAQARFRAMQRERAIREVYKRYGCDDVQLLSFEMDADIELTSHLLPAYEWKPTPKMPPVIISALSNSERIVGGGLLSPTKLGGIAMAVTTVASFFFPPLRACIVAAGAAGMLFGFKGREWQHFIHEKMHEFSKGKDDEEGRVRLKKKKKAQEREKIEGSAKEEGDVLDVDPKHFRVLGLNPKEPMTREKIKKAFHDVIMKAHQDHGGSKEKTQEVLVARKVLLDALQSPT